MTDQEIEQAIKILSRRAVKMRPSLKRRRLRHIALDLYREIKSPIGTFEQLYGEIDTPD